MTANDTPARAATCWLALIDKADYDKSWQAAAPSFRTVGSEQQWTVACQVLRSPCGKLVKREITELQRFQSRPGYPHVDNARVEYKSVFTRKASCVETVKLDHKASGAWLVTSYTIK